MSITTPLILDDYLSYLKSIRALSEKTISEYRYDLINFIYYQILRKVYFNDKENLNKDIEDEKININKIFNKSFISDINIQDMYSYISYLDNELNDNASTRSRKISALRSFYKYLHQEIEIIDNNITEKLRNPKIQKRQPVYLTLSETEHLLDTINEEKNEFLRNRDMAIVFTFLTTGMRLSELVSVDLKDIKDDHFTIIGKGNKERTIYLTKNCIDLIDNYIMIRKNYLKDIKIDALFISTRKKRISNRAVQSTVDKYLKKAGFDTRVYSTHKLRHTAATLMYKYGNVDIRALKDVLGHESVSTTQIYTHLDNEDLKRAVNKNPLSNLKI
ncbi:tyrosine recombinase XerC [Anaerococcus hydrogenalis]|uniref:Tyrosine recombinase XerC n=1 Tax=Anaerococcus hydrogenalis TaxID=33029 RepID=A0A2N6UL91_9FIRM|nr:tyrosine recombinase XerC [Anaerococcus hydrogenalis]MDK7694551.1 tyrosine recombinase XerC [Anaerococcus hydrogenalis]MDK7696329.1 tyrosine recombinase XerC [Anaerococcus hydrogenalis]MDK7707578.1 tyrosine recombinase XerC [Anaerococcus hydrogenalis]PMC82591.1 tyrosine recombinase XerC [Anaerococcus hydrogenalis]